MSARATGRALAAEHPGEAGNALILMLVLIIVVSVACAAVLQSQPTGLAAQSITVSALRKPSLSADAAIDTVIGQMRYNAYEGSDGGGIQQGCNKTASAIGDSSWSPSKLSPANDVLYTDTPDSNAISVVCVPDTGSGTGTLSAGAGDSYTNVVRTMGGVAGPSGIVGSSKAAVPFCDGTLPATHTNCEVGVLIGRGTSTTEAGVTVAANGAQTPGPLILSNSGIYVNGTNYPNTVRNLNVEGTIWSRFQCAGPTAQYRLKYSPAANQQAADWWGNPSGSQPTAPDLATSAGGLCEQGSVAGSSGSLLTDPISDFKHELWSTVIAATTGSCTPDQTNGLWAASWTQKCGLISLTHRSFTSATALTQCANGLVTLTPGWYDDASGLNTLLTNSACNNVVVWLSPGTTSDPTTTTWGSRADTTDTSPGVYYFDFNGGGEWGGNGQPTKITAGNLLWIVGGTPKGWNAQVSGQQSTRNLDPQRKTAAVVSPNSVWSAPGASSADFAAEQIDGTMATLKLPDSSTTAKVQATNFGPAMSANANVGISGVKVRLAYNTGVARGTTAWQQLNVDVQAGTAHCIIPIAEGAQAPWEQNLTTGCPVSGTVTNGPFPGAAGTPWTPALVNGTNVTVNFQESTSTSGARTILFDGAQLVVDSTGPPSPPFPGACDTTKAGVQMIFGTQSHIDFDNSNLPAGGGNGVFFDVCGSPGQSAYSPAVYGLTDHAGTQVCCGTVGSPWYKDSSDSTVTLGAQASSNFAVSGGGGSCVTVQDAVKASNDSCVLDTSGTWASTSTNPATVSFTLPNNLVSDGNGNYDPNAVVERVEFDVTHQEGADVNNVSLSVAPSTGKTWPGGITLGTAYPTDTKLLTGGYLPLANSGSPADWQYGVFADSSGKVNSNWPNERWTADNSTLGNPAALNGATVTYTVTGPKSKPNRWAKLDRLVVRVVYRPSDTLRPLNGCLTLHPGVNWQYDDNNAAGPSGTAHTNYAPFSTPTSATNQPYMSGTDRDFAANVNSSTLVSSPAYTWSNEPTTCAIVQTNGVRFTVEGAVYAPTAAFDIDGNANGASFVTNTVVTRQFTETRDVNDDSSNLLGTGGRRKPRSFTLYALDSNTKRLLAAAHVTIDDRGGYLVGTSVVIDSWIKRPGQ